MRYTQAGVQAHQYKSLEDWVKEQMETPSGTAARRARWHETLSKFDLEVQYLPGKENVVADAFSRFAYPACKAFRDAIFHGSAAAREEMKTIIEEELREGRTVGMLTRTETGVLRVVVAGTLHKCREVPPSLICSVEGLVRPITRSGRTPPEELPTIV